MEENELLDPFNEIDIASLYYKFIPRMNNKLDAWQHACQSITYGLLKLLQYVSGYRGKLILQLMI